MRKRTDALGTKFDLLREMINDYGPIKQTVRECDMSRDWVLMQMHTSFLQQNSMLIWIYV
jgi:hypothetical protein